MTVLEAKRISASSPWSSWRNMNTTIIWGVPIHIRFCNNRRIFPMWNSRILHCPPPHACALVDLHFPSPVMKISNPQFFKRIDIVILNPTLRNDARNKRSAKLIPTINNESVPHDFAAFQHNLYPLMLEQREGWFVDRIRTRRNARSGAVRRRA